MALRRLLGLLRTDAAAAAAAAARARARPLSRSPPRRLISDFRTDSAADAAARGRKARDCPIARVCAQGGLASSAILACAQARARAAREYLFHLHLRSRAAAASASRSLHQGYYVAVSGGLKVAYGQSAPMTPSPLEMFHIILALLGKAKRIDTFVKAVNNAIDFFHTLDPEQQATFMYLFSLLVAPVAFLFQDVVSTAPEPVCPFLGLQGMPFDVYPVEQGINEVVRLAASSCGVMTLTIGGLVIIFFMDLLYHPWILQDPVVPVNSNSSAVLLALISCSAVDKLRKVTLRVLAKSLSEEEFLDLSELFKTLDRGNSGSITAADLQQSIKWVGSKLADHEVQTLLDAADVHPTARIEFGEFLTARFSANNLEAERRVVTTEEVSPMGGASVKTLPVDGAAAAPDADILLHNVNSKHAQKHGSAAAPDTGSKAADILLTNINSKIVSKVIEYNWKHIQKRGAAAAPNTDTDSKGAYTSSIITTFDQGFVKVDLATLFDPGCELGHQGFAGPDLPDSLT